MTGPDEHDHEWERGRHMADAFYVDGRILHCAICGTPKPREVRETVPSATGRTNEARDRIPAEDWIWDGHAAHLRIGSKCQFHLATRIGDYQISTVGEYVPESNRDTDGQRYGGDEYAKFETVGLGRLFETYVFRCTGPGFGTVDSLSANDHDTATRNHMQLCRKYAALPQPKWHSAYAEATR